MNNIYSITKEEFDRRVSDLLDHTEDELPGAVKKYEYEAHKDVLSKFVREVINHSSTDHVPDEGPIYLGFLDPVDDISSYLSKYDVYGLVIFGGHVPTISESIDGSDIIELHWFDLSGGMIRRDYYYKDIKKMWLPKLTHLGLHGPVMQVLRSGLSCATTVEIIHASPLLWKISDIPKVFNMPPGSHRLRIVDFDVRLRHINVILPVNGWHQFEWGMVTTNFICDDMHTLIAPGDGILDVGRYDYDDDRPNNLIEVDGILPQHRLDRWLKNSPHLRIWKTSANRYTLDNLRSLRHPSLQEIHLRDVGPAHISLINMEPEAGRPVFKILSIDTESRRGVDHSELVDQLTGDDIVDLDDKIAYQLFHALGLSFEREHTITP